MCMLSRRLESFRDDYLMRLASSRCASAHQRGSVRHRTYGKATKVEYARSHAMYPVRCAIAWQRNRSQ